MKTTTTLNRAHDAVSGTAGTDADLAGRIEKAGRAADRAEHFSLIRTGVDIRPMLEEVLRNFQLMFVDTSRQETAKSQRDTQSILLAKPIWPFYFVRKRCFKTRLAGNFPVIMGWLESFSLSIQGELGKAMAVELKPYARVYRHIDTGEYYKPRDRYHLVLKSGAGSIMGAGDETAHLREGELWAFNNKQPHDAYNPSGEGRIHLIFDIFPKKGRELFRHRRALAG